MTLANLKPVSVDPGPFVVCLDDMDRITGGPHLRQHIGPKNRILRRLLEMKPGAAILCHTRSPADHIAVAEDMIGGRWRYWHKSEWIAVVERVG